MKIRTRAELRRLGMMGWAFRGCFTGAEAAPVAAETAGAKGAADAGAALVGGAEGGLGAVGGGELAGLTAAEAAAGGTAALGAGAFNDGAGLVGGAEGGGAGGAPEGAVGGATGADAAGAATDLGAAGTAAAAASGGAAEAGAGAVGGGLSDAGTAAAALPSAEAAPAVSAGPQGATFASEAPGPAFSSAGTPGAPVGGVDAAGAAGAAGAEVGAGEEEMLAKIRAANADSAAGAGAGGSTIAQTLLDKLKANPLTAAALGVNIASQIGQRNSAQQVPAQLKAIAAPAAEVSKTLLDQYKTGEINPSTKFEIDKWKQQQIAATKNYYARAGIPNSTAALNAVAAIEAKAVSMADLARQGLLKTGLDASGMAAGPLTSAVEAQAAQDKSFAASQGSALNSLMLLQAMESGRTPEKAGV